MRLSASNVTNGREGGIAVGLDMAITALYLPGVDGFQENLMLLWPAAEAVVKVTVVPLISTDVG